LQKIYMLFVVIIVLYGCSENVDKIEDKNSSVIKNVEKSEYFILDDGKGKELNISINNSKLLVKDRRESIILFNIFASWCKPCMGQIPYLAEVQKRESEDLLIIGVSINDNKSPEALNRIFKNSNIRYFISKGRRDIAFVDKIREELKLNKNFTIPLSIIYKDGKLYRYYEGSIPMEMLETEIKNAKKLL